MSDSDERDKSTAADVRLTGNTSFRRKVGILFRVAKAKPGALEANTCKRAAWRQS